MRWRRSILVIPFVFPILLLSIAAALPQGHSAPPSLGGRYNVVGTNPGGSEYRGTLTVTPRGGVYQFRWNAGTQYDGVGVKNGKMVAVAFANGNDGTGCGVVDYLIEPDGTLQGKWGYWGTTGAGTERAKRVSGTGLAGDYAATGTNPDGTRYQVALTVNEAGGGYKFFWSNKSEGFGIERGNSVAVGIGGERCGFVSYELKPDGSLDGIWGSPGGQETGTERATKQ